ncbi:MAG: OmpA family protein [Calditrichae bacterium]|nr:OmpA family protein [Calditrichia bacterium]
MQRVFHPRITVPHLRLEIEGHSDNRGSAEYSRRLSENRAKAVMDYLIARGIASNRLSARDYGFERPAASNVTAEGRAQNRRLNCGLCRKQLQILQNQRGSGSGCIHSFFWARRIKFW